MSKRKQPSKSKIVGRFVNVAYDQEIIIAFDWSDWSDIESTITIVLRSIELVPQSVKVFRSKLAQINSILSYGECVQKGSLIIPESSNLYKTVHIHSGKSLANYQDENFVTISEYKLENPHKELSNSEKLIGFIRLDFVIIKNQEKVEISKFIMKARRKELLEHKLFSKTDSNNRKFEDVPLNYDLLNDVKEEMWKLKYMIRHSCCFEDCERTEHSKCSRCHHYTCSIHSTEQFEVEYESSDNEGHIFDGEILINFLCGHCSGMFSVFSCLKWY